MAGRDDDDEIDETEEILRDPELVAELRQTLANLDAGAETYSQEEVRAAMERRHRLAEMTRQAAADGLYETGAEDYTEALRRARGKEPPETPRPADSALTAQANAAIEKSGQDEGDTAWVVEMSRKRFLGLDDDQDTPPPSQRPIHQIVAELNAQLGATLVAALSGTRNSKEPYGWEAGDSQPGKEEEKRLRLAHELFHVLAAEEGGDVARAFFIGSNPVLNDDTIVTALREGRFDEARAAVRAFITDAWTF